jgi:AbrB family looped-hinge helix DNA binding protein
VQGTRTFNTTEDGILDGTLRAMMATIVEIDKAGRIVVPKKLRDALHLTPGTQLTLEREGDRLIFQPQFAYAKLVIEDGLPLIYPADDSNPPVLTNEMVMDLIEQGCLERERRILGLDDDSQWNNDGASA